MQREATNIEEQMIVRAIQEEATWDKLPKRLKLFFATAEDWNKKVKDYCIKKRLKWSDCLARMTCKESEYYEELVSYLRKNQALFPYHLSDYVCRVMRISSFRYYCDILCDVMKNEKAYDSMPNFTAADALRLTGVGRNEFIDIMNKCRAKKIMWKINKSIVKDMLPTQPVNIPLEPWWKLGIIDLTPEELKKLAEEDTQLIQKLTSDNPKKLVGENDTDLVRGLFQRGIVYLDVPVFPDDHFQGILTDDVCQNILCSVSTLEGFVSNKEQSYEDPTEELLYAVFVASSERATVAELATTLQADLGQLEAAVSLACRLGWARKLLDPESLLTYDNSFASNNGQRSANEGWAFTDASTSSAAGILHDDLASGDISNTRSPSGVTRFAFMVDANLTSYLMMGSLSPGLKGHSVTLYEAGKLGDSSVADMCEDLQKVEGTKLEGELQEFADHAFSLRYALECLRAGGVAVEAKGGEAAKGAPNLMDMDVGHPPFAAQGKQQERKPGDCKVDVIRCESLSGLTPATVQRVLRRDYNVVVSMVPLPSPPSVVSPDGEGPIYFGPPSQAALTPWMKLLLYSVAQSGPVSVVLIRGQRLRLLPPYLAGCAKALVWSWDGSSVGGVGGKFEGTHVEGGILLHCLNSLLKQSAVLVQPFPGICITDSVSGGPLTKDIPLPIVSHSSSGDQNFSPHPAVIQAAEELNLRTAGYIRFVRVCRLSEDPGTGQMCPDTEAWEWVPQSVEFGIPLFSKDLCKQVCEGLVHADLFHPSSLLEHGEAMHALRKTLMDFIANYQPSGSVCKLAYDPGKMVVGPQRPSVFTPGQWSPDRGFSPLTPTLTPTLQQPTRTRRRSEVASFVGELPKLLPLGTLFEAPSRAVDDTNPVSPSIKGMCSEFIEEEESGDVPLPGLNLLFDGLFLTPFDISACLQGRMPAVLVAEAAAASCGMNSAAA